MRGGAFVAIARAAMALAWLLSVGATARAQSLWFLRGSDAAARVVGAVPTTMRGPRAGPVELGEGDYAVHFAADALGKPDSLGFDVPEGARVHLAVAPALAVAASTLVPDAAGWHVFGGGSGDASWVARCTGEPDARDYRVVAAARGGSDTAAFGVVARWHDETEHYRFVWDRRRRELRLERRLGSDTMVLGTAPAPADDDHVHELALQVSGFRLQACCDEAIVVQAFDGAMTEGAFGTWTVGEPPDWQRLTLEPPAAPRASSAVVQVANRASLHARVEVGDGHYHVLELVLDRPHALVPRTASGLELWLMQRPAAPEVLFGDWRNSLGPGSLGEVHDGGVAACELLWPSLARLRHEAALLRFLLASPDGEVLVDATPPVPLIF